LRPRGVRRAANRPPARLVLLLSCHRTSRAIALTAAGGGAGAAGSVMGRAPGRGTNGESIADLLELRKDFLKVLFYRRSDGAGGTPGRVGGGAGATAWQAKLRQIKEALRRRMHQPIPELRKWLGQVVRGFFNDHAAPTNSRALAAFRHHVMDRWRRTLGRRSQKDHTIWARMIRLENDWLPKPNVRFAVKHPSREPDARIGPVRIRAGGARQ
jgi:hypothetical protein